jgi:hypothetical protein
MAIIPSTQKFHTVSTEVDTQNKGSLYLHQQVFLKKEAEGLNQLKGLEVITMLQEVTQLLVVDTTA